MVLPHKLHASVYLHHPTCNTLYSWLPLDISAQYKLLRGLARMNIAEAISKHQRHVLLTHINASATVVWALPALHSACMLLLAAAVQPVQLMLLITDMQIC